MGISGTIYVRSFQFVEDITKIIHIYTACSKENIKFIAINLLMDILKD